MSSTKRDYYDVLAKLTYDKQQKQKQEAKEKEQKEREKSKGSCDNGCHGRWNRASQIPPQFPGEIF